MSKIADVLQSLIRRTSDGKLGWQTSVDPDRFLVVIDTIGVTIRRTGRASVVGDERYQLEILNDQGTTVEVLETKDPLALEVRELGVTEELDKQLSQLFTLARRSALDADATLEKLANSLDNF